MNWRPRDYIIVAILAILLPSIITIAIWERTDPSPVRYYFHPAIEPLTKD